MREPFNKKKVSIEFSQTPDTFSSDICSKQYFKVTTESIDGKGVDYLIFETERWAVENISEFMDLLDALKQTLKDNFPNSNVLK